MNPENEALILRSQKLFLICTYDGFNMKYMHEKTLPFLVTIFEFFILWNALN